MHTCSSTHTHTPCHLTWLSLSWMAQQYRARIAFMERLGIHPQCGCALSNLRTEEVKGTQSSATPRASWTWDFVSKHTNKGFVVFSSEECFPECWRSWVSSPDRTVLTLAFPNQGTVSCCYEGFKAHRNAYPPFHPKTLCPLTCITNNFIQSQST